MATVKKSMAKKAMAMKKSAPKKAAPMMGGSSPMMKKGGMMKKAKAGMTVTSETTKNPKDLAKMYGEKGDSTSAVIANKMMKGQDVSKDVKNFKGFKAAENKYSKKGYGTTPAQNKKGGVVKKAMKMGGKMSKMSKKK
jgi:hypothetical protein